MDACGKAQVAGTTCPTAGKKRPENDLTWLLHRAAHRLRDALDEVARNHGSGGIRDFIVLNALATSAPRAQAELGEALGLDKTTLTSLLDRLESEGLVVRKADPENRRVRIPELTEAGRARQVELTRARDAVEAKLLAALSVEEQHTLRALLLRFVTAGDEKSHLAGSCM